MTRITAIRDTKRGRYALFGDENFLFSVDEATLLDAGIAVGDVLSEAALTDLRERSDARKAVDQALRYLSLRAYAERELYNKLLDRYDEHTAAAAVAKMLELGLLNDAEFAARKAEGMAARGKSAREIADKLRALGVDRALAAEAVNGLELDGAATALALVQKNYMAKLRAGKWENVAAALARRGFTGQEIRAALQAAAAELAAEDEALAAGPAEPPPWEGP